VYVKHRVGTGNRPLINEGFAATGRTTQSRGLADRSGERRVCSDRRQQRLDGVGIVFEQRGFGGIGPVEAVLFLHDAPQGQYAQPDGRLRLSGGGLSRHEKFRGKPYQAAFDGKLSGERYEGNGRLGRRDCALMMARK
jgi:hypothetical protein